MLMLLVAPGKSAGAAAVGSSAGCTGLTLPLLLLLLLLQ
jgi:hypothetical protein